MRRAVVLAFTALVLLFAAPAYAQVDKDCDDFATQAQAQSYFKGYGGSATNNVDRLDADHDGWACDSYDYPVGGRADGGTEPMGGQLAHTGPAATLTPLAILLLAAGGLLVWVARYRPRHTRT